jgi:hypothetical protein
LFEDVQDDPLSDTLQNFLCNNIYVKLINHYYRIDENDLVSFYKMTVPFHCDIEALATSYQLSLVVPTDIEDNFTHSYFTDDEEIETD